MISGFNRPQRRALTLWNASTTALALIVLVGGATAAAARPVHHRHVHWRDANASIGASTTHSTRTFSGMASYYGNEAGHRTASGQRFNQNALTAAHRSLPFGTRLRVTHAGRSVIVTVNDRGPFVRGRVLDLSTGAARAVGLTARGVGPVVAEVL